MTSRTPEGDDDKSRRKPGPRRSPPRAPRSVPPSTHPSQMGEEPPDPAATFGENELPSEVVGEDPATDAGDGADAGDPANNSKDSILEPCRILLEELVDRLGGSAGVLYSVEGPRRIDVLSSVGTVDAGELPTAERAAVSGIEAQRPLVVGASSTEPDERPRSMLVVPCKLHGDVVAVLLVFRRPEVDGTDSVERQLVELGPALGLALAADRARIHRTLERRMGEAEAIRRQLEAYAVDLRSVYLSERSRSDELGRALVELEETYDATVRALAIAVEAKDEYTGGHLFRVCRYGMAITALAAPAHQDDPQFEYGFLLHDVGKLSVPDAVLAKSGALTEEEWEQVRAHPASGRNILGGIPFLAEASEIVFCHHERWDGQGFPRAIAGEDIPLGARIFPVADAFDAMTTSRPYRHEIPIERARLELLRGSGSQFWPDAVEAFMDIPIAQLEAIRRRTLGTSDQ
jgi:HD-GYP domain-containing protein (c-di-GMP phosphodiesterase class II)